MKILYSNLLHACVNKYLIKSNEVRIHCPWPFPSSNRDLNQTASFILPHFSIRLSITWVFTFYARRSGIEKNNRVFFIVDKVFFLFNSENSKVVSILKFSAPPLASSMPRTEKKCVNSAFVACVCVPTGVLGEDSHAGGEAAKINKLYYTDGILNYENDKITRERALKTEKHYNKCECGSSKLIARLCMCRSSLRRAKFLIILFSYNVDKT